MVLYEKGVALYHRPPRALKIGQGDPVACKGTYIIGLRTYEVPLRFKNLPSGGKSRLELFLLILEHFLCEIGGKRGSLHSLLAACDLPYGVSNVEANCIFLLLVAYNASVIVGAGLRVIPPSLSTENWKAQPPRNAPTRIVAVDDAVVGVRGIDKAPGDAAKLSENKPVGVLGAPKAQILKAAFDREAWAASGGSKMS